MMDLWNDVSKQHMQEWNLAKGRRVPMMVMANRRTLNVMVSGVDDAQWSRSDKVVFKTSRGDLHFFEHRMMKDGEVMYL